jgi:hypothetical protein
VGYLIINKYIILISASDSMMKVHTVYGEIITKNTVNDNGLGIIDGKCTPFGYYHWI